MLRRANQKVLLHPSKSPAVVTASAKVADEVGLFYGTVGSEIVRDAPRAPLGRGGR